MCSCSAHPAAKPTVLPVCTSRRAGKSIGGTVYFRPVGGGSVFSELPIKRVLRRHVRFDDGRRRSDELWRFLGIPVEPSTSFTDRRGDHDVLYGPNQFGSYASFPTATDIPFSSGDSFLGLRYTIGADTFYRFAQFAGGDLAQVPEPSIWAMMMLGFVGTALLAKRRRSLRLA
jgi:PEP-CTERM motif